MKAQVSQMVFSLSKSYPGKSESGQLVKALVKNWERDSLVGKNTKLPQVPNRPESKKWSSVQREGCSKARTEFVRSPISNGASHNCKESAVWKGPSRFWKRSWFLVRLAHTPSINARLGDQVLDECLYACSEPEFFWINCYHLK